jgi:hypothetical protein
MPRKYSSTSVATTLTSPLTNSSGDTILHVVSASNLIPSITLNAGDQFTLAIDPDTVDEEIVFVYSASTNPVSSNDLTVIRNRVGTTVKAHNTGAIVKHVLTSDDLDYFTTGVGTALSASSSNTLTNKSISLATNTVTGTAAQFNTAVTDNDFVTLTGAQTLTDKTLTSPTINTPVITFPVSSVAINSQTAAYTLTATDKSKLVIVTSSSTANVTVPPSVFSQGDVVYISRSGSGALSLTQGAGVTITGTPGLALRAQSSVAAIICTGSNTFIATGDLSA